MHHTYPKKASQQQMQPKMDKQYSSQLFKTNSAQSTVRVKINTGAQACTILLNLFKMFPNKINSYGTLVNNTVVYREIMDQS